MKSVLKDMLGTEIHEGSLLFWSTLKAPVKVLRIEALPSSEYGDARKRQGKVTVSLALTFDASREECFMNDFIAAIDPEQTKAVETLPKVVPDAVDAG